MKIKVNLKSIAKRKNQVKPITYQIKGHPSTVRELILAVTETGVEEYNQRSESLEVLKYLTKEEIADQAGTGKISYEIHYGEKKAELKAAQENAIQSFEDGIYRIFLGDDELEDLEENISITEESVFTFVRLTMLAGRMW